MEREFVCILLEALGGEFVLDEERRMEIIEGTSNREYISHHEPGVGRKYTVVHVPEKPGKLYSIPPDPDAIPGSQEGRIEIIGPADDEDEDE
jgi:hypothetical protein